MNSSPVPKTPPAPEAAPRPKTKQLEVMVADVIQETPDATTLILFTGNDTLPYQPGHFLTIDPHQFKPLERFIQFFEDTKGKREAARAYSLSSAPHEGLLAITIKEEAYVTGRTPFPPLLSPLLVWRTPRGTRMTVTGFGGPYVLPPNIEDLTDHLVHICAGSGIVPNFSILKHALHSGMKLRHTLIYGNRTWEDIIFRDQLAALAAEHPGKLEIVHALSRDENWSSHGDGVVGGRVSAELIRRHIGEPSAVRVFACGPAIGRWDRIAAKKSGAQPTPRFMETVLEGLDEAGVPPHAIHRESYG